MNSQTSQRRNARTNQRRPRYEWIVLGSALILVLTIGVYFVSTERELIRTYEVERLQGHRTVNQAGAGLDKPLVVGISRELADLDRPWKQLAAVYAAVWVMVCLCSGWALLISQRRRSTIERWGDRLDEEKTQHSQRMELALSSSNQGMWEQHLPSEQVDLDQRAAAMLGYKLTEPQIKINNLGEHIHGDDKELVNEALVRHISGATPILKVEMRMAHQDGHWVWVHCRGQVVEWDTRGVPLKLVGIWLDISERKLHEREIERLAFYDGLTGLANRRLLMDRLQRALARAKRYGQCGAVMFIDLDNFKTINDTLGHYMGDKLLKQVAIRLGDVTRSTDTVARLGGDEFVVMLEGLDISPGKAHDFSEKLGWTIVNRLSMPYELDGNDIHSSPSVGVVLFDTGGTNVDELLKHADLAMYDAKAAGRGTLRFFKPGMQAAAAASVQLENDLRQALQTGELLLYYQPIYDVHRRVVAVEALVRWQHPVRGMVAPAEFIPLAEQTGLIIPLGQWVLHTACRQLKEWSAHSLTSHISMSVNVSARQFRSADFVAMVAAALSSHHVNPSLLKLEITESMLLSDVEDVIAKMKELRSLGVGFSLDDFGTGYSSLSYLKRLPFDQLKIDRSFVHEMLTNPSDAAIAKAIVELGHSLGLTVIAEGVETAAQHYQLLENKCDGFQGYLFSRPSTADSIKQMLQACEPVETLQLARQY